MTEINEFGGTAKSTIVAVTVLKLSTQAGPVLHSQQW